MTGWMLFALFLVVGVGMLVAGIYYLRKDRHDAESVKLYRTMSLIGVCVAAASAVVRFATL